MTLSEFTEVSDKLRLPISLVLTPVNLQDERQKFFDSDIYNPQFRYRIVKNDNRGVFEALRDVDEIVDVDPRISDFYIQILKDKMLTDELMNSAGDNERVTKLSIKKYGLPSPILFRNACRILRGRLGAYKLMNSAKLEGENYLEFPQIEKIVNRVFFELGLEGWKVKPSLNIARNGVKVGVKAKEFLVDGGIRKRPTELKKTIIHEIATHVLRSENGALSGYPVLKKANLASYLDAEEGMALYNEELYGLLSEKDLRKRAMFVWGVSFGVKLSFRELYNAALGYVPQKEAFDFVYRLKRGMGDTALPGMFVKDIVYFRGFRRLRRRIAENSQLYKNLYAGKIGFAQVEWVEEGLIPKPQVVPDPKMFEKIFKEVGL